MADKKPTRGLRDTPAAKKKGEENMSDLSGAFTLTRKEIFREKQYSYLEQKVNLLEVTG